MKAVVDIDKLTHAEIAALMAPEVGAARYKQQYIPNELRADAVLLLKQGIKRKEVRERLGISETAMANIAWRAQAAGLLDAQERGMNPVFDDEDKPLPGAWTAARKLAMARLLKKRVCIEFIAEELTRRFEGPVVRARDVVTFSRETLGAR